MERRQYLRCEKTSANGRPHTFLVVLWLQPRTCDSPVQFPPPPPIQVTVFGRANHFIDQPRPTQPPTLRGTGNEYWPKFGDALQDGSFQLWTNIWMAGKTV